MSETELKGKVRQEEIIKCGKDPVYFMKRYVHIPHVDRGLIKFETYPFQDDCVKAFREHKYNIINKSRQLGLSTVTAAYCLWMAIFQRQKNILVIATKFEVSKTFLRKVQGMFDSLPQWLVLPRVKGESVKHLEFSNGSRITAIPTSRDAGRSEALSLLVVDEAAHIEDFDELWAGIKPTISTGGSVILLSSPKGVGTLFHKLWLGATNKSNNFNPIELPWTVHPEHDQAWFDNESRDMDERQIAQEFLCNFNSSGQTYVNANYIQNLEKETRTPIATYELDPNVWIWKFPEPGKKYIVSADVSRGDSDDFSAFHVFCIEDSEVVAEYQGKKPPDRFAELLIEIGMFYNVAMICNEINGPGQVTSYKLRDSKYPNLYYEKISRGSADQIEMLPEELEDYVPGVTTSVKTRTPILSKMEQYVRNKDVRIFSTRFVEELKTFMWHNNRAQAQKGYNDDLVMSFAIGAYIYDFQNKTNTFSSKELTVAMMNAWGKSTTTYNSALTNIPGISGFSRESTKSSSQKVFPMLPSRGSTMMQKKIPPGVHPEALRQHLEIQEMFGWVEDPKKKEEK